LKASKDIDGLQQTSKESHVFRNINTVTSGMKNLSILVNFGYSQSITKDQTRYQRLHKIMEHICIQMENKNN